MQALSTGISPTSANGGSLVGPLCALFAAVAMLRRTTLGLSLEAASMPQPEPEPSPTQAGLSSGVEGTADAIRKPDALFLDDDPADGEADGEAEGDSDEGKADGDSATLQRGNLVLKQLCERLSEKLDERRTSQMVPVPLRCERCWLRRIVHTPSGASSTHLLVN
uniref:Uncharacterized protein n=1 Tax=Haptolina ericina TaxID=156174 RepID=A0A7S3ASH6_9EUKA